MSSTAAEEEALMELSEDEEDSKPQDEDKDDDVDALESSSSSSESEGERKRKRRKPKNSDSDTDTDSDSESESEAEPESESEKDMDEESESESESESDAVADADSDSDSEPNPGYQSDLDKEELDKLKDPNNPPEDTARQVALILAKKNRTKPIRVKDPGDKYNFPRDPENWREEDLMEVWADGPLPMTKPGFDPYFVDKGELEFIKEEIKEGNEVPIAPFYVPFRRYYPVVPTIFSDISTPKLVIEELDRIEEFLKWVSYIFDNGTSYEGTVWDDVAQGKGVLVGMNGMVRYEGEWFRNEMEGHGVVEVDVPHMEPIPGSKFEEQMRAEGQIISRDFMSPEDRKWLEKDIEDSLTLANGKYEIPFYDTKKWIKLFGSEPEKGRYRYAGQWKHGRFHGCGVYEVNEQTIFGRFYFGQYLDEDTYGCDAEVSAMHAGIAEVAAAKARMFVNKPDGMVREYYGPYSDPQHPYLYEEDDVWMAPGFINQFYEVPDYWKMYAHEVDQEREMWLNSFYRAPLRLPMPSELEYWWWCNDEKPEFVLINKEPVPDPENPENLIYEDDPLILHTPTGRIINYVDDEEHGIRLFWQPPPKDGEDLNPDNVEFLPLGFDEFYGFESKLVDVEESIWMSLLRGFLTAIDPLIVGLREWAEEKKKETDAKIEQLKKERELVEIELNLKQAAERMDKNLRKMQKEEERKAAQGIVDEEEEEEDVSMPEPAEPEPSKPEPAKELERTPVVVEEKVVEEEKKKEDEDKNDDDEDDDDEDDEDEDAPSSFGSIEDQNLGNVDQKGGKFGKSTFAASSLSFAGSSVFSWVPPKLQSSFLRWKEGKFHKQTPTATPTNPVHPLPLETRSFSAIRFPNSISNNNNKSLKLRYTRRAHHMEHVAKLSLRNHRPRRRALVESEQALEQFSVLSWHTPLLM